MSKDAKKDTKRILLADDEEGYWNLFRYLFEPLGYAVAWARDGDEILEKIRNGKYDLVLLDVHMPRSHVPDMVKKIRSLSPAQKIVIWSSQSDPFLAVEEAARDEHDLNCLYKPVEVNEIYRIVFGELGDRPVETPDRGEP